jgi:hypothetical protein
VHQEVVSDLVGLFSPIYVLIRPFPREKVVRIEGKLYNESLFEAEFPYTQQ